MYTRAVQWGHAKSAKHWMMMMMMAMTMTIMVMMMTVKVNALLSIILDASQMFLSLSFSASFFSCQGYISLVFTPHSPPAPDPRVPPLPSPARRSRCCCLVFSTSREKYFFSGTKSRNLCLCFVFKRFLLLLFLLSILWCLKIWQTVDNSCPWPTPHDSVTWHHYLTPAGSHHGEASWLRPLISVDSESMVAASLLCVLPVVLGWRQAAQLIAERSAHGAYRPAPVLRPPRPCHPPHLLMKCDEAFQASTNAGSGCYTILPHPF